MYSVHSGTALLDLLPQQRGRPFRNGFHLGTLPCSFLDSDNCRHICCSWRRPRQGELPRPNALKVILCLTPVLFLFLPKTAPGLSEIDGYPQLAFRLTIQVTIDLFDAVEMLDIVFDESENDHGIPKWFGRLMVAVACFSFLLSLLQPAENKLDGKKIEQSKCLAIIRNVVQMVFVNLVFMVIRLVIFFKYKKEGSIFIAKNGIAMYFSALEIYSIWQN